MKAFNLNQIKLISAITDEMSRQCPGIPADNRMNTVVQAANYIVAAYARAPVRSTPGMGLSAWLASDDTGASSRFMAGVLSGQEPASQTGDYPRDADDLGRCIRLLEAASELVDKLERLKQCGPRWAQVVENWKHWEKLYHEGRFAVLFKEMHSAYSRTGLTYGHAGL